MAAGVAALDIDPGLATANVPTAEPDQSVAEVRAAMAGRGFDHAGTVVVLAEGRLAGVVPLERLLEAAGGTPVADLMDDAPPAVLEGSDGEAVVWDVVGRGEATVPVVDARGRFVGVVPPDRLLALLLRDHDQDLARLGGYLDSTADARNAAEEGVGRRLWHRIPWLLLGLLGAMASAVIVGGFEEELDKKVLVAFFLPAVVYMADAVGTQTETVVIRGLSVGIELRKVVGRELATGVVVGALMAARLPALRARGLGR